MTGPCGGGFPPCSCVNTARARWRYISTRRSARTSTGAMKMTLRGDYGMKTGRADYGNDEISFAPQAVTSLW